MTALAGVWWFDGRPDSAEHCARILAAQELYGRHAVGQWSDGGLSVGRRLLRVLPEDAYDRQPMVGGGGRYILIADIRLDNRDELVGSLSIPETHARTISDACILLAAIERWGESCFDHLVGDYAFALWDAICLRLMLARDPLGQRPLHYHRGNGFVAFASMPKGLHALPQIPIVPDEERVAEFITLLPETGSRSFFVGVERVEPGNVVTISARHLSTRRHWQPSRHQIKFRRPEDYCDALRDLLDQAVRSRLRGTGNIGVHLSGGLDSGAVAATAARLLASTDRKVVAFTAVPRTGYDGPMPRNRFIDEGPHAAETAALYPNIQHVLIDSKGRSPLDDLDRSFLLLDRPVLNICNIGWSNSIYDAARSRKLTIMLGGDEGNIGLSYNGLELLSELMCSGRWLRWWKEARALVGPGQMRWRGVLANTFGPWCPADLWVWLNRVASGHVHDVTEYSGILPRRLAELDLPNRAKACNHDLFYRPRKSAFATRLRALQTGDSGNYYKGILGGWQIDYRDPTADIRLMEFCLAVPTDQFLRDGIQRSLARRALSDRLPQRVVIESRKGLQAADWHERLTAVRGDVAIELDRLSACPAAAKAIDIGRLRSLIENWPSAGWEKPEVSTAYRYVLLRAISAGHFFRRSTGMNA